MSTMWAVIIVGSLVGAALLGIFLGMVNINFELFGSDVAKPNMLSYWNFDQGESHVKDFGKLKNNGTITGTASYTDGKQKKAFVFDGVSYITIPNEINYDFERTNPFSVSLWLRSYIGQDLKTLVSKNSESDTTGWSLFVRGSPNVHFQLVNTSAENEIAVRFNTQPFGLFDNKWHHIVVTYDGSGKVDGVRMYYDGESQKLEPIYDTLSGTILNDQPITIGTDGNTGSEFTGQLDEIRIYDKALSADEVSRLYKIQ